MHHSVDGDIRLPCCRHPYGGPSHGPEVRHSVDPWNDFLYVAGRLVATPAGIDKLHALFRLPRFIDRFQEVPDFADQGVIPGTDDVHVYTFANGRPGRRDPALVCLAIAVEEGLSDHVAVDHVLTPAGHANFYAARSPESTLELVAPQHPVASDCLVGVVDVGFHDFGMPQRSHTENPVIDDGPVVGGATLTAEVGHGEWVAWLVSCYVPPNQITARWVGQILIDPDPGNVAHHVVTTDSYLAESISGTHENIVTLTFGGPVGTSLLATKSALENLPPGVLVVAAIGNDGKRQTIYPAAFPTVLAVGASQSCRGARWRIAPYNNRFLGIDVYAPGEHVVPFVAGDFMAPLGCSTDEPGYDPGSELRNFAADAASIAGTSFAVPVVAGVLAQHCNPNGNARAAALSTLYQLRQQLPGFIFPY